MRRLVFWIVMLPAAAVVVVFALNNRDGVALDLWPFKFEVVMPVYLLVLAALGAGAVFGGIASWFSGGPVRGRYREKAYEAEVLRRELAEEKEKSERRDAQPQPLTAGPRIAAEDTTGHAHLPSSH